VSSARFETIGQAIASFEEQMRQRMISVEADTRQLFELMHADNNQEVFSRIFSTTPYPTFNS